MTDVRATYKVVIEPLSEEDGGGFLATVPELPGCMSDGETRAEALVNIEDAITAWIFCARKMGRVVLGDDGADAGRLGGQAGGAGLVTGQRGHGRVRPESPSYISPA